MFKWICEDLDLKIIADSGQCFRMYEEDGRFLVIAREKHCYAYHSGEDETVFECPDDDNDFWKEYFDLDTDYKAFRDSVDPDDTFLLKAVEYGKGIRILRQDPWEMLITFIISQRRSIPSIRTCVERICTRWGSRTDDGIYSFPSPDELSCASIAELCECGLGYRAEYVYLAAKAAAEGTIDIEHLKELDDCSLLAALMDLRGVGTKVANCVSLFGFHRIGAFPVDVWIDRVQKQYYQGRFPVEKYEGYAGIMQQYIFYSARNS